MKEKSKSQVLYDRFGQNSNRIFLKIELNENKGGGFKGNRCVYVDEGGLIGRHLL